jgi:hypothetical protein
MYRNEWTHANMDMVHWEAHSQALRKNFLHGTFLVKFIHDKLPVGKMIALYKNQSIPDPYPPHTPPILHSPLTRPLHLFPIFSN